jgi:hypothetical protein
MSTKYDRRKKRFENEEYYKEYREKYKKWKLERRKDPKIDLYYKTRRDKYKNDINYKLNNSIKTGVYYSLKKEKNGRSWENLVGYTLKELKDNIEKKFIKGMSWSNYGKWHIDHIFPKSKFSFNGNKDLEIKKCWSLNNLQPLWAKDNIKKSNKVA